MRAETDRLSQAADAASASKFSVRKEPSKALKEEKTTRGNRPTPEKGRPASARKSR